MKLMPNFNLYLPAFEKFLEETEYRNQHIFDCLDLASHRLKACRTKH